VSLHDVTEGKFDVSTHTHSHQHTHTRWPP